MAPTPLFHIGQIVEHRKYHYRGVIYDVDREFGLTDEWYEAVALSRPLKNKPWYHVLPDGQLHTTYVAERHLVLSFNKSQVFHPLLGDFFQGFDGSTYVVRSQN